MTDDGAVAEFYGSGTIWERLTAALADDGVDVESPTLRELAPYDQFHGRGLEATIELADSVEVAVDHHLLDVGSGLGGPARVLADRFGCRATGIDLTAEFCEVAQRGRRARRGWGADVQPGQPAMTSGRRSAVWWPVCERDTQA